MIASKEFSNLPVITDLKKLNNVEPGYRFLHGEHIIAQKHRKKSGDFVTFYEIIKVDGGNLSYMPVTKILGK